MNTTNDVNIPHNGSITLDDLASMVKVGFDDLGKRVSNLESSMSDMRSDITDMRLDMGKMATKDDLGKLRSDMIDYIAKQNLELKTDLVPH